MSSEYRVFVDFTALNGEDAERIRDAIKMIKGVRQALWNETPVMPATNEFILRQYLDELNSPNAPELIPLHWIISRLDMSSSCLREWTRNGYVDRIEGIRAPIYERDQAIKAAYIWYLKNEHHMGPRAVSGYSREELEEKYFGKAS